jgi:GNAT superfamily N-acetyltransferase
MELITLTGEEITTIYHEHLTSDFARDEVKPLGVILKAVEKGTYDCLGLLGEEGLAGYVFLVRRDRNYLVDYLAIFREDRNKGLGSELLRLLGDYLADAGRVILEVEDPDLEPEEKRRETMARRIAFYRRNHWTDTGLRVRCFGVPFWILQPEEAAEAAHDDLWRIYRGLYGTIVPKLMLPAVIQRRQD